MKMLGMILVVAGLAGGGYWFSRSPNWSGQPVEARSSLPTAIARQGEFLVITTCRGDLVASRSVLVTAPLNVPDLRIVWQAPNGDPIKAGEVMLKFDVSSAQRQNQEKEASLRQAEAQLAEAMAQAQMAGAQSELDIATQKTQTERARLEVSRGEILSVLQAEEKKIDHRLAQDKLRVKEADAELIQSQNGSKVAALRAAVAKVQAEVDLTKKRIGQMEVRAPAGGVVNYLMNYSQGWMNAKPFKVGDTVWPGSSVAEIPDLSSLQLKGKLEETERGRMKPGLAARILLDPFPEKPFEATLAAIAPLAEQNFEWPPSRNFRAYGAFAQMDGRLRPGMNGRLDVIVDRLPQAISVPAKAIFNRNGKPVVLVPGAQGLDAYAVEVLARNLDEVAVKGIAAGTKVALVDTDREKKK